MRRAYFSVGITSFNPRLQERSSPRGCNPYRINPTRTLRCRCHRGRASTRPYIACCTSTKYAGIASKNAPRITPRSCRGDWEVARHTSAWRTPRTYSGVAVTAGELPLAPTLYIANQQNTHGLHQQEMHPGLHRVAVGATGRSPAHPHGAPTRTSRGCCYRGRASTRPYIACCTPNKIRRDYINKNTPRVTLYVVHQ